MMPTLRWAPPRNHETRMSHERHIYYKDIWSDCGHLKAYGFRDDGRAGGSAAAILTVGVSAAKVFPNQHERALRLMTRLPVAWLSDDEPPSFPGDWQDGVRELRRPCWPWPARPISPRPRLARLRSGRLG